MKFKDSTPTNEPFGIIIKKIIKACESGEYSAAERMMGTVRSLVKSTEYSRMVALQKIVIYLDECLVATPKGETDYSINLLPPSSSLKKTYFELLKNDYELLEKHVNKIRYKKIPKKAHKINIIQGGRPVIHWADGRKWVIGKTEPNEYKEERDLKEDTLGLFRSIIRKEPVLSEFYIVTPCFNSSSFIDSTIMSIISQEGPFSIHYHVQDGGSTDGTIEKLQRWQKLLAKPDCQLIRCREFNLSFATDKDSGMYEAINKGVKALSPPEAGILSWINSDDVLVGGALATVLNVMLSNNDASWVIGAVNGCNEHQEELSMLPLQYPTEIIKNGLCEHKNWSFIQQEGSFWRASLWMEAGGLNDTLKLCGDWDLWRRFAHYSDPIHVLWPLGRFRIHGKQLTTSIQAYYDEMNTIVPEQERDDRMDQLVNVVFDSIKVIKRPMRAGKKLHYETVALQKDYIVYNNQRHKIIVNKLLKNFEKKPRLKVLTLCTLDFGGAGTGSMRRVEALRDIGVDVDLLSLVSKSNKEYCGRIEPTLDAFSSHNQEKVWKIILDNISAKVTGKDSFKGNEFFSLTDSVIDFIQLQELINDYDIIHLHWVVGMIDYENMAKVLRGKPIVWTTADMNPFTGGCHYSEGCSEFMNTCSNCPMVSNQSEIPNISWRLKKKAFDPLDISLVCPSVYIAELARHSSLLGSKPVHVIPNAYPIDRFIPVDQYEARKKLGLPTGKKLVLFGSESVTNYRKGGDFLSKLVALMNENEYFDCVEIVFFGDGKIELPKKVHRLGKLNESTLKYAYSAADIFISLSREDVGPMTVVESMLCGTPVVGFPVGIIPDVIEHCSSGYIASPFNLEDIIAGIAWVLDESFNIGDVRSLCRTSACEYADPVKSAERHKALYESLVYKHVTKN